MRQITCLALFAFCFLLFSCDKDDDASGRSLKYEDGVFICNEGPFLQGSGTVSFRSRNTGEVSGQVFSQENMNDQLGNIVQSMAQGEDAYLIAVNNASKLVAVTKDSFKFIQTISDIPLPRHIEFAKDDFYVSYWGEDGVSGGVLIIDGQTYQIKQDLSIGGGPERFFAKGNDLYVTVAAGFGTVDNRIVKIDLNTNTISATLNVADNPLGIVGNDKDIWVLCAGINDFYNPDNNTPAKLQKLVNDAVVDEVPFTYGYTSANLILAENDLFFTDFSGLRKIDVGAPQLESSLIYSGSFYAMGYDDKTQNIYLGDAKDFSSTGEVYVLDNSFTAIDSFNAGIIPTHFTFID